MLHYETVSPDTLRLLKQLTALPELSAFCLVGGTSLSLQIGHRISVDLDFFTDKYFDTTLVRQSMQQEFSNFELASFSRLGFSSFINHVKCDFYNWSIPFIGKNVEIDELRLCSLQDIVAFKLDATITRKEKKDFCDIAALLNIFSFVEMLDLYKKKYPMNDIKIVMDALAEIDLADVSEEPVYIHPTAWADIKFQIKREWKNFEEDKIEQKIKEKNEREQKLQALFDLKKKNKE